MWGFFVQKTSSLQCDEVKTHVVTNLISFQWSTYQCRQTIPILLILGLFYQRHLKLLFIGSVADPECLSRIPDPTFFHPGSRIRTVSIPDPGSSSKKQKNGFQALKNKIRVVHPRSRVPDPDADFFPSSIPDPGVKKVPNPESGSATLHFIFEK